MMATSAVACSHQQGQRCGAVDVPVVLGLVFGGCGKDRKEWESDCYVGIVGVGRGG